MTTNKRERAGKGYVTRVQQPLPWDIFFTATGETQTCRQRLKNSIKETQEEIKRYVPTCNIATISLLLNNVLVYKNQAATTTIYLTNALGRSTNTCSSSSSSSAGDQRKGSPPPRYCFRPTDPHSHLDEKARPAHGRDDVIAQVLPHRETVQPLAVNIAYPTCNHGAGAAEREGGGGG